MMKRRLLRALPLLFAMILTIAFHGSSSAGLVASQKGFPNGKLLVSADSVQKSIGTKNFVIIDARTSGYEASHIPGAINVKYGAYFNAGTGLKDLDTLQSMLGSAGLKRTTRMVIYDNTSASFGAAGRIFWMLEYLGCGDVHILDGGWDKWIADERPTESVSNTLSPTTFKAAVESSRKSTKDSIAAKLGSKKFAVVDARTDEEYNGWQLYGEARGGHIPGAVQIPYAWFFSDDKSVLNYKDLKAMFESRGITKNKEVTANCTVGIRSGFVYFLLRLMGYSKVSNYDASIVEWAADSSLQEDKAANYSLVVYPGWVQTLLNGGTPLTYSGKGYKIFEVSWGATSSDYDSGHIPGAVHFDTNNVEARDWTHPDNPAVSDANEIVWDLVSDNLLQARFRNLGINDGDTVIVYGSTSIAATRAYWALRYAGIDVRFLNGGFDAWVANGGASDTAAHQPAAVGNVTVNPQNQIKALTPEVLDYANYFRTHKALLPGTVVVDVRSKDEYVGASTGYSYDTNITRKGRIPGAEWGRDADSSSPDYMDADGTLRSYPEVENLWQSIGATPDKTLIFHCGTGWRSTLAFLYADLMGYPNIKNYDSWYVWSTYYELSTGTIHRDKPFNDPNIPIDTGWPGP